MIFNFNHFRIIENYIANAKTIHFDKGAKPEAV